MHIPVADLVINALSQFLSLFLIMVWVADIYPNMNNPVFRHVYISKMDDGRVLFDRDRYDSMRFFSKSLIIIMSSLYTVQLLSKNIVSMEYYWDAYFKVSDVQTFLFERERDMFLSPYGYVTRSELHEYANLAAQVECTTFLAFSIVCFIATMVMARQIMKAVDALIEDPYYEDFEDSLNPAVPRATPETEG